VGRDHRKLVVFTLADRLVGETYAISRDFPTSERFGLQSQLRRAAVSTAVNIVEGSARRTTREYLSFLNVAAGSAAEAAYLTELSVRLEFLEPRQGAQVAAAFGELVGRLQALVNALSNAVERQEPRA
jgi:four helix bundle protein